VACRGLPRLPRPAAPPYPKAEHDSPLPGESAAVAPLLDQVGQKVWPAPIMATQAIPTSKLDRDAAVTQRRRGQIRPQHTEFFEFLIGASLDQQRNEVAHPAAVKASVSALHYSGDVVAGKSGVLVGEATLDIVNESLLFLRHPVIVTVMPTAVKPSGVNSFYVNRWRKTLLRPLDSQ